MHYRFVCLIAALLTVPAFAGEISDAVGKDYDEYLAGLFDHFHRNPELSTIETETARRMAVELSLAGLEVTEGVGGTVTAALVADAVWDEATGDHTASGSFGEAVGGAGTPAIIADAVWDEPRAGHVAAGSMGLLVQVIAGMAQANHRLKSATYDAEGRLLTAILVAFASGADAIADSSPLATVTVTNTYDSEGNLTSVLTAE